MSLALLLKYIGLIITLSMYQTHISVSQYRYKRIFSIQCAATYCNKPAAIVMTLIVSMWLQQRSRVFHNLPTFTSAFLPIVRDTDRVHVYVHTKIFSPKQSLMNLTSRKKATKESSMKIESGTKGKGPKKDWKQNKRERT